MTRTFINGDWVTRELPSGETVYINLVTGEQSDPHRFLLLAAVNRGHVEDLLPLESPHWFVDAPGAFDE